MNLELTQQTIALQQRIHTRLSELGYADGHSSDNISAHLAQVAVLGRAFSETKLPLFLTLDREHGESLAQVGVSMKCDLEEIRDALHDVDVDLQSLVEFLRPSRTEGT
jgi:hypothetical protein